MRRFEDKVAMVTGAGSGIGRATVLAFAREGARVAAADINLQTAEETTRMVKEAGGEALPVKADVTISSEVTRMVEETVRAYGRLDCAFNCAGISTPYTAFADLTEETWNRVIAINLTGVFLCMKYEIVQMLKNGGGAIVNASSIAGLVGSGGWPAYYASKHGVIGLTKAAGVEYAKAGIRVNAVCPHPIDTPLIRVVASRDPNWFENVSATAPIGRMGKPEEVAEAVIWLCSHEASLVTGHAMAVDGGYTAK
jgi:NAD(P)-dependent dehydrogenase (short-subunit alcohol dehydrogenase family)